MKIYENQTANRVKPVNLQDGDARLFCAEFQKDFTDVYSRAYQGLYVLANGLCMTKDWSELFYGNRKVSFISNIKTFFIFLLAIVKVRNRTKITNGLLLTDCWSHGFFHWFGDVLQKLEALEAAKVDISSYTFIMPKVCASRFAIESLKNYDIKYKIIEEYEIVFADNLLYIPQITTTGNYRPELMQSMRERFKNNYKVEQKQKRTFITRSKALKRTIINEPELIPILKEYGFNIVAMEELTFDAQYKTLAESGILISLHGAGLTHMLWMEKGSKVIEIRARNDARNNCYFSLASDLTLEYYYLLADKNNDKSTQVTDFMVNADEFRSIVELITTKEDAS
jgi:capsular polysaccharide biosynthesis protein